MNRLRPAPLAIALTLAFAGAPARCLANDTSASVNAGGFVFEKSAAIQMKSEVLSISRARSRWITSSRTLGRRT